MMHDLLHCYSPTEGFLYTIGLFQKKLRTVGWWRRNYGNWIYWKRIVFDGFGFTTSNTPG